MTRDQLKHLRECLSRLQRQKHDTTFETVRPPAQVLKARHIVKAWDAKQRKISRRRQEKLTKAYHKTLRDILFLPAREAMKSLQAFERFRP